MGHCPEGEVIEPFFMLTVKWKARKHQQTREIIPTCTSSQMAANSQFCVICWMLALALWLQVFEDENDGQVCRVIFEHARDILRPQSKLKIRTEWLSVPIILADCLRQWTGKDHHTWDQMLTMATMLYVDADSIFKLIAEVLGWDNLHFYIFRRMFATWLTDKIDNSLLKLLMGHVGPQSCCSFSKAS